MWHIWKAMCSRILSSDIVHVQQVVQAIWHEMVITLKAQFQFDNAKGSSDMAIAKTLHLHQTWEGMSFYTRVHQKLVWFFSPPKWLFPPPIP